MTAADLTGLVILTEGPDFHHLARRSADGATFNVLGTFRDRAFAEALLAPKSPAKEQAPPSVKPAAAPPAVSDAAPVSPMPSLADEMLAALSEMMATCPKGPTASDLAARLNAEPHHVRKAMLNLHLTHRALRVRRLDSSSWHMIPLGYLQKPEDLTPTQARVLEVMRAAADADGNVSLSKREIALRGPCSPGSVDAIVGALVNKGRLSAVSTGSGTESNVYSIVDVGERA